MNDDFTPYEPPTREEFDKLTLDEREEVNRLLLHDMLASHIRNTKHVVTADDEFLASNLRHVRIRLILNVQMLQRVQDQLRQLERPHVLAAAARKATPTTDSKPITWPFN